VFWPRAARVASAPSEEPPSAFWTAVAHRVQRRPAVLLAALVLVLGGGAAGFAALRIHADWTKQFSSATDGTRGFEVLRSRFPKGSLATTTILVSRAGGPVRPADVGQARRRLMTVPGVAAVLDTGRRSRDAGTADLQLVFAQDPWSSAALGSIPAVRHVLHTLGNGLVGYAGEGTARQYDYRKAAGDDFKLLAPLVLAVVFVMLVILLRAIVMPIFLLATVALSYFASFGFAVLFFRAIGQPSVDAELPLIVFIFLVVLGSDYNIFLMSAVRERAHLLGTREAFRQAVVSTGPVITSAGVILAATFAVLAVLPVWELIEIGVAVSLGILIDTFLVRTVLVPAGGWLLGERAWWPFRPSPAERLPAAIPGSVEQ
jgi:RND superfamily putative drug exporter